MAKYLNIGFHEEEEKSIYDELDEITNIKPKEKVTEKEDKKKKKKEKKKKKKDKSILSDMDDIDLIINDSFIFSDNPESEKESNSVITEEDHRYLEEILDMEDADEDDIVGTQKRNYNNMKKGKDNFKKEFAEEITLLYGLLDDNSKFGKKLAKICDSMLSSKARGMSKIASDMVASSITCRQNSLNIIKEIANIKKNIATLKLNAEKAEAANKKNTGNEGSAELLAANYLKGIVGYGRNNFVSALTEGARPDLEDIVDEDDVIFDGDADDYNDVETQLGLLDALQERLENSENKFRSESGNKYIKYEHLDVTIMVKRCVDTGEWEFIAVDKDNQQIDDYPLPDRKTLGKMRFTDDGSYATDSRGRSYKVIEYYSYDE